ncbi:cytochrome c3 [Deltaproteobacteria bacterium]|nr:cytochrome c3 [Deltaproteobacteria bacterium]
MKKSFVLLCLFIPIFALSALAAPPPVPTTPLVVKGSKKEVMFPHAAHQKVECVVCHHLAKGEENFQKCATAGCHDDLTARKGKKSMYAAVHEKTGAKHKTCIECHNKVVAEKTDMKKEMLGCAKSKCHP